MKQRREPRKTFFRMSKIQSYLLVPISVYILVITFISYGETNIFIYSSGNMHLCIHFHVNLYYQLETGTSFLNKWSETCHQKIWETQKYLEADNVSFTCEALEAKGCEKTYQR